VFEIFSQASAGLGHSQGGLGIGLYLVKSLVSLHGGSVVARSAGEGRGSEFEVRLPVAVTLPGAEKAAPRAMASRGRRRILIADDNLDAADSLALMLELYGNDIQVARDGVEALAKAELFRPQIALLDIGMPNMDGYEAARQIRSAEWGRDILLVALTGWGQSDDRRRAFEAGFDSHLTKPARPEDLEAILGMHA
jgi:CheY-like chemotaxis protein